MPAANVTGKRRYAAGNWPAGAKYSPSAEAEMLGYVFARKAGWTSQLARRSRRLALRSKNRAWLSTADTVEG